MSLLRSIYDATVTGNAETLARRAASVIPTREIHGAFNLGMS